MNHSTPSTTPSSTPTLVPIEHQARVHDIDAARDEGLRPLTLMELVDAVSEVSETEQEVLATVTYMLKSGRVQLMETDATASLCG